jgi:hypothetical protein
MPRIGSRPPCPCCGTMMFMSRKLKSCTWHCGFCGFSIGRYHLYSQKQRAEVVAGNRSWRLGEKRRRFEYVQRLKVEARCPDCGGKFHSVAMDFDHVSGAKVQHISRMVSQPHHYSWDALLAEIAKCEIVCANCHRVRTHERGIISS